MNRIDNKEKNFNLDTSVMGDIEDVVLDDSILYFKESIIYFDNDNKYTSYNDLYDKLKIMFRNLFTIPNVEVYSSEIYKIYSKYVDIGSRTITIHDIRCELFLKFDTLIKLILYHYPNISVIEFKDCKFYDCAFLFSFNKNTHFSFINCKFVMCTGPYKDTCKVDFIDCKRIRCM